MSWFDLKEALDAYTGLGRDALHIHAALFLYILAIAVFRRSRRSRLPWLVVLAAVLANELYDILHNPGAPADIVGSSAAKDLWNTMLWPTVLLLVGRHTDWFQHRPAPAAGPRAEAAPNGRPAPPSRSSRPV